MNKKTSLLNAAWQACKQWFAGCFLVSLAAILVTATWCAERTVQGSSEERKAAERNLVSGPIQPIRITAQLDAAKVALGNKLFHDPILSKDNTVSCATCHLLGKGGADQRGRSLGIRRAEGAINAPTVFNSSLNFKQFWDGRAESLEDQVDGPALSLSEMGSTWEEIVKKLIDSPSYRVDFEKLYRDGVKPANVKNSIAEFERSLLTPNARFDKFLLGDDNAINAQEKSGYRKFRSFGCASCHQGINVGGNMFETLGAMADYFKDRGGLTQADLGRFNVTHKEDDRYVFKVPSLRNVELTAPYFHDGSMTTLGEAVQAMAKYQLGRPLSKGDVTDIVAFLKTLTGEYQGRKL